MNAFEYAMALISIVVGLAIADLTISFQKLFRQRRIVTWDARVLAAAAFGFILLFTMWYELWSLRENTAVLGYPFLLSLMVEMVLLFLMTTMLLPDDPGSECDLGAYYVDNARAVWGLFALFQLSYVTHWIILVLTKSGGTIQRMAASLPFVSAPLLVALILVAKPRHRLLHLVMVGVLIAYHLCASWGATLAPSAI